MLSIIRVFADRLKTLFLMHAILEVEADLMAACAERSAKLLQRADQFAKHGAPAIAEQLRRLAELLWVDTPLGSVLKPPSASQPNQTAPAEPADVDAPAACVPNASSEATPATPAQAKSPIVIEFDRAVGRHFRAVLGPLARSRGNRLVRHHLPQSRLTIVN